MQDFQDDNWRGSPGPERMRERDSRHEGEPFDDINLTSNGYKRTIYDYELPDRTLLYQNCRYDDDRDVYGVDERKKKFLPRRPKNPEKLNENRRVFTKPSFDNSDFVFGPGEQRVIYNWPAIIKAIPLAPVFVCMGEKNASDVMKSNKYLFATTVLSGSWTPQCVGALAGRELFIMEDNDESGRREAARYQRILSVVAKSTRIITTAHLWKHLPPEQIKLGNCPNADVSDWLEDGGDATKLIEICREVPADGEIKASPHSFPEEKDIPPWEFLYGKHLLRGTVSVTAGMGASGKSTKAITEALAMTTCKPLLRVQSYNRPLRVLVLNLEDDRGAMDKRVAAAMRHYHLSPEDVSDRLITVAKGELKLKIATHVKMGVIQPNAAAIRGLTEFLIEHKIDVASIDPLRKTHQVSENDNVAMGEVIELYEEIAAEANCAVHIWHHVRKGNGGETTIESLRGASSIVDAARSCELVEKMTKGDAESWDIEERQRGFYFRTFNGKLNFAPPIEDSDWFKLESVTIENAWPFGDNVGVVTSWTPPDVSKLTISPENIARIKEEVGFSPRYRHYVTADMWVGKAVARVLGLDPDANKKRVKELVSRLIQTKVLKTEPAQDRKRTDRTFVVATTT